MKNRLVKTGICIDWMGCGEKTADQEFAELKQFWSKALAPIKLDFYRAPSTYPGALKEKTELVLYDFGGVMCRGRICRTQIPAI